MWLAYILSFTLGFFALVQGGLNRHVATSWGLAKAMWLTTGIAFASGTLVFFLVKNYPQYSPQIMTLRGSAKDFQWWFIIPGLVSITFATVLPFVIYKIGALKVTLIAVAAQIVFSFLWDKYSEGIPITWNRLLGAAIMFGGLLLATLKPAIK